MWIVKKIIKWTGIGVLASIVVSAVIASVAMLAGEFGWWAIPVLFVTICCGICYLARDEIDQW